MYVKGASAALQAFGDGFKDRPDTTFGTVNADVLEHFVPGFQRLDLVDVVKNSAWTEQAHVKIGSATRSLPSTRIG